MVRLKEHKDLTEHKETRPLAPPEKVYIPLSQHIGKACSPLVKAGDIVTLGQKIASADAAVSAPVHASVSGKVGGIVDHPHPLLGKFQAVLIENDGKDTRSFAERPQEQVNGLNADQIRGIISDAGIVGMGGAAFPTYIKLKPSVTVDSLIINGAECEPYITADSRLMIERTAQIIKGIALIVKCTGVKDVYIAIEDNKPEAISAFSAACGLASGGNPQLSTSGYKLRVLRSHYPQGGEKQLIKAVLKREVPPGKLPFDIGVVVQNVATVFAIYEAVYSGKPLFERVVSVTGDCLLNPANLIVRIGTPLKDLLTACGPFKKEPKKIIFGGPMMGIAQYNLDVPVIKSTNGIVCLSEGRIGEAEEASCIRCSRCVENCPLGIMPCMISLAAEKEKWDLAKAYGCLECMECGLCNYICPQKRNIVQAIKQAKQEILKRGKSK